MYVENKYRIKPHHQEYYTKIITKTTYQKIITRLKKTVKNK